MREPSEHDGEDDYKDARVEQFTLDELQLRLEHAESMPECAEKRCRVSYWNLRLHAIDSTATTMDIERIELELQRLHIVR
jgi:hypothetical protein